MPTPADGQMKQSQDKGIVFYSYFTIRVFQIMKKKSFTEKDIYLASDAMRTQCFGYFLKTESLSHSFSVVKNLKKCKPPVFKFYLKPQSHCHGSDSDSPQFIVNDLIVMN